MTRYLDMTHLPDSLGTFIDTKEEWVAAGTIISSMPIEDKNEIYHKYAKEYDIHFVFDNNIPTPTFYCVPLIEIIAYDSQNGYIGVSHYLHNQHFICYINKNKECFKVAKNLSEFLIHIDHWEKLLRPCHDIHIYTSFKQAKEEHEFIQI